MKKNWLGIIKGVVLAGVAAVCVMASVKDVKAGTTCGCGNHSWVKVGDTITISGSGDITATCGFLSSQATQTGIIYENNIEKVVIEPGITKIENNAFYYCKSLKSIEIPSTVTLIGISSFDHCESLTSIIIPNSVKQIETQAFYYCKGLTSITIPNSVTEIEDSAFYGCSELTSITIPNGVEKIGRDAFGWCSKLTSITIPNSVNTIKDYAFRECTSLTSITIPSGVTTIGSGIFYKCSNLKTIKFEGNPTSFPTNAFSYALNGYEYIYLPPKKVEFGKNASKDTINKILGYMDISQITEVVVPDALINDLKDVASLASIKEKFVKYSTEHPDPEPVPEKSEQEEKNEEQQNASEGTPAGPSKSVYEEKMDSLIKDINALISSTASTSSDKNAADGEKSTDNKKTLYLKDVTSLSLSAMKALRSNPNVNLDMTYTYKGIAFHVVIPAGTAVFDESIPWYGPLWLYARYGQGTLTNVSSNSTNVYVVQSGDTLRKIAAKYGMTLDELIKKNPKIKNVDKISIGDKINL